MLYEIRLEQVTSRPLAVVRRQATLQELPTVVPAACGLVWNVVKGQKIEGAGRLVAIYHDDKINLEVGVELNAPFAGHGEVVGSTTPAGTAVTTVHYGPYGRLAEAYRALRAWCAAHNHALTGPCWEIYGHWLDAWNQAPSLIRTDVFYLITR